MKKKTHAHPFKLSKVVMGCDGSPSFWGNVFLGVAKRKTAEAFLHAVRTDEYFQYFLKIQGRLKKIHDSVPW